MDPIWLVTIVIIVPSLAFVLVVWLQLTLKRPRRNKLVEMSLAFSMRKHMKLTYRDIAIATNCFSSDNLIGRGGYGSVFIGQLNSNYNAFAVKVFDLNLCGSIRSFHAECEAMRNLRHRNLLAIITSCSSLDSYGNEFKALVFEYMPNGSLEQWLHPDVYWFSHMKQFNLIQIISIAMDVASALCYLHHHYTSPVIHCDLKPSNVLLGVDMTAYVSDFGLARFLGNSISSMNISGVKGSIGYIPPEYGMGNQMSTHGDVYSYGIIILEMLTRKKPIDKMFQNGLSLHTYVQMAFPDKLDEVLDPLIFFEGVEEFQNQSKCRNLMKTMMEICIIPLAQIGLMCSMESPKERMDMKDVVKAILSIKYAYLSQNMCYI
ncbi:receptor-like protein kinase 1 [Rhynchospora pubera]|uniref:Receptor kinase-like protein Xa21 n=1 Tax=Rhynchospora pubera TaxID=906938 RepID=A0AAV8C939_9POAL|nr:receptor-like protein kinase 1 [Rhynchospora pubera]